MLIAKFTARDPKETCNETLIDHELSNVEGAKRIVTASASNFVGCANRLASLMREKGEETHDTSSRRRLVQRREGDDGEHGRRAVAGVSAEIA